MFRVLRPLSCVILMVALPGLAMAGDHGHGTPPSAASPRAPQQDPSALPDSVRRVERTTGGEVLSAEPMQRDGREVYRIKVLTADGRVRVMQEDPQNRSAEPRGHDRKEKDRSKDKVAPAADGQDVDQPPAQE